MFEFIKNIKKHLLELPHNLAIDRSGTPAIEFALAFPVIFGLTMGIVEIGHITFANATLEGAVREASRRGVTGFVPDNTSREDHVRSRIVEMMDIFALEGDIAVDTQVYDSFSDIGKPEPFSDDNDNGTYDEGECFTDINQNGNWDPDMGMAGLGGAGAIVVYSANVNLRLLTPVFRWMTDAESGTIRLEASTAVRNEPFNLLKQNNASEAPTICS